MTGKPNTFSQVMTGREPEVLKLSSQYQRTTITITGNSVGVITVKAKPKFGSVYEDIVNGTINLKYNKTLTIRNIQLDSLQFTITPSGAYNVEAKQYDSED